MTDDIIREAARRLLDHEENIKVNEGLLSGEEWALLRKALTEEIVPITYEAEAAILEQRRTERLSSTHPGRERAGLRPLSAYDTGEVYEPKVWPNRTGRVDFENDESATAFTLFAHPSPVEPEAHSVVIDGGYYETFRIFINDTLVWQGRAS